LRGGELMNGDELVAKWDRNFANLSEADKEAKEKGQLVGRYLAEPYADGRAYYRVVKEGAKTVVIEVVTGIGDDWIIPYWGERAVIKKEYAIQSIARRDALDKIFEERRKHD